MSVSFDHWLSAPAAYFVKRHFNLYIYNNNTRLAQPYTHKQRFGHVNARNRSSYLNIIKLVTQVKKSYKN